MSQDNSSGYDALRHGAGLIDRSALGRIALSGRDRRSYLQGLLSNDIEVLTAGTGCYAAMLTAQGRMMTDMRVLELGDEILLDLPGELTVSIRNHLDRFVFSEDVQVIDVTAARAELGVYGPGSTAVLHQAGVAGALPAAIFQSIGGRLDGVDVLIVRSDEAGVDGFDIVVDAAHGARLEAALTAAGAVRVTEADAEAVRVERGRPRFGRDMDVETIPLEAGIEDRAISRTKGCYVGQEVIVRVQDRGHGRVAKRLAGLTFEANGPVPAPGAPIASADRDIGRVTSAVWSPALGRPIALGYVHRDFLTPGTAVTVSGAAGAIAERPFVP